MVLPGIGGAAEAASKAGVNGSGVTWAALVGLVCCTPIQLLIGAPLYQSAWTALRFGRTANIDFLVMLSTSVAYFYSLAKVILAESGSFPPGPERVALGVLTLVCGPGGRLGGWVGLART